MAVEEDFPDTVSLYDDQGEDDDGDDVASDVGGQPTRRTRNERGSNGGANGDWMRHSRHTLYHSALDLQEVMVGVGDETRLQSLGVKDGLVPGCCAMFNDGVRRIDFVLVWQDAKGGGSPPSGQSQETSRKRSRALFQSRLLEEGLHLEEVSPVDRLHFVKIHTPVDVLRRYCEILRLRMPMKQVMDDYGNGGEGLEGATEVLVGRVKSLIRKLTSCLRLDPSVFPPDKFALTAEYSRHKSYLFDDDCPEFFSSQVRTLVVDFILERTSFSQESELIASAVGIQKLISDDVYKAAYPLHDGPCNDPRSMRNLLLVEWAQVKHWAKYQPIDQIREYFGVKYALYFAWLGFYTHMLIPASIVGLLVFLYGCVTLYRDTLSRDICDDGLNITMCPLCDRTCDYWRLSDTCTYAKVNYLIDNPLTVVFAIFMSFWATLFLELWKRYSASVAHRWGLTDYCPQSEPPRAQYLARVRLLERKSRAGRRPGSSGVCKTRRDHVTGMSEPYVSFWRVRLPATVMSFSVVFLLVIVAVVAVFAVVLYRMCVLTSVRLTGTYDETSYAIIVVPSTAAIINLICIMLLNWVYDKIAVYLTELELHRTQTEFDESLTVKIYLFQFVNYYTSIMYIAFLKGKFVGYPAKYNTIFGLRQEECSPAGCLMELCIQLAVIMVGQQAYNAIIEMLIPFVLKWFNTLRIRRWVGGTSKEREAAGTGGLTPSSTCPQWTEDYKLLDWGPRGLFYEYLEMVMQYGFVTLFVTAFPLAPVFALLNNVFEMRLDAKKFLKFYRRPVPRRAPDIGVWFRILNVLGRLAVISNAFIIAFSSNFVPRLVYMVTVSEDGSDSGFLEHSLSYFDTRDFAPGASPRNPTVNASICRYSQYRQPPDVPDPALKYKRGAMYWHVLAARLAFIVIFQNVVSVVMIGVQWCIPDVPSRLRDRIKREAYLTNELIIRHETAARALLHPPPPPSEPSSPPTGPQPAKNHYNSFAAREAENRATEGDIGRFEEIELQERA